MDFPKPCAVLIKSGATLLAHPLGQFGHAVGTVPCGKVLEVEVERVISLHVVGLHVTFHVTVPAVYAAVDGVEGDAVQRAAVHGRINKVVRIVREVVIHTGTLRAFRQQVVAEGIVQLQVARQALHHLLLARGLFGLGRRFFSRCSDLFFGCVF